MTKPGEKLLRPLHRQRRRRRTRAVVLSSDALAAHFGIASTELEDFMIDRGLPFHKDSRGELWASVETTR